MEELNESIEDVPLVEVPVATRRRPLPLPPTESPNLNTARSATPSRMAPHYQPHYLHDKLRPALDTHQAVYQDNGSYQVQQTHHYRPAPLPRGYYRPPPNNYNRGYYPSLERSSTLERAPGHAPYRPAQQLYPAGEQRYRPFVPVKSAMQDSSDTASIHSNATTSMTDSSRQIKDALIPHENLEAYRQTVKKSKDPKQQFAFAKQLIIVAEEMRKNPQGLEASKVRKNRDILHLEAHKWIKKAASASVNGKTGLPEALFFLADCYGNGTLGLTIDHGKAFGYYTQGAKHDHPASIYRTGVCYEVGAGPKKDHARAITYYKKAATLGDTAAMFKAGMILLEGSLSQQRNPREGVNFLRRAAAQADEKTPYALHELAILYEGINVDPSTGVVPDPSYAYDLYLRSSKLGYAPSQYKLGLAHEYGHLGLPIDARFSIAWYTKAAQQGEAEAELALSGWYLTGFEGFLIQSDTEAYLWARKAADKGLAKAEYAVAYFLEHGVGTNQDLEEARRWYLRSAGQANPRAIARLKDKGTKSVQNKPSNWRQSKDAQDGNCTLM